MEPNWIQCYIEKSNWVQCYWMEPKWINVMLIGIPLQVLCYWKESYWIQYYVDCNTTEHDVNVWNLWELNVIFRGIPLSLLLWMTFILNKQHRKKMNGIRRITALRTFATAAAKKPAFKAKTTTEVWTSDTGAYPIMGILAFAAIFPFAFGIYSMSSSPDARLSKCIYCNNHYYRYPLISIIPITQVVQRKSSLRGELIEQGRLPSAH